jgi:predicted CoA-binding protein
MLASKSDNIVILGASDKPERYAHMAYQRLLDNGFNKLIGVTPKSLKFDNMKVVSDIKDIAEKVHTLTLYVGSAKLTPMIDDILKLAPKRIICNPGTENHELMDKAHKQGIEVIEGCTLVMLGSKQF